MSLREYVEAYEAQRERCGKAFEAMRDGVTRELDAVGGYATTSPNAKGYCHDYHRHTTKNAPDDAGFSMGATRAGKADEPGKVAPYQAEAGDRCFVLEMAWRSEAILLTEAQQKIEAFVALVAGEILPPSTAAVAIALARSELAERDSIVQWIRRTVRGVGVVDRLADAIEHKADLGKTVF